MKKICFIVAAVLLLSGCRGEKSEIPSIVIDTSNNTQVCLSEIAEKIDRVELEVTDKSLIREVRYVEILNNHFFIHHGVLDEVLMFDVNGRFIKQVGRIGRGPGEYTDVLKIAVDMDRQELFLNTQQGIIIFDDAGEHVKSVKDGIPYLPASIFVHNKQLLSVNRSVDGISREITVFLTTHNTSNWNLMDSVFVTSYHGLSFAPFHLSQSNQSTFLYYKDFWNIKAGKKSDVDTLYVLENHKLRPYLTTHFIGKKRSIGSIAMSDNYGIITHAISVQDPDAEYPRSVYSQYYFNVHTMKGRNSKNGFIDDFNGNQDVLITPIPNTDKFYYYVENNEYSSDLKTTPNPTLYIGTFRK